MAVSLVFGKITYHDDDRIEVPFTSDAVLHSPEVSDFNITDVDLADSYITGEDMDYSLFLTPEPETQGQMIIDAIGNVYKNADDPSEDVVQDNISGMLIVNYDTREPDIISRIIPSSIVAGLNSVYIEINRLVKNITPYSFDIDGVNIIPRLYAAESIQSEYQEYTNSEIPRRLFRLDFEMPNPPPIGNLNIRLRKGEALGFNNPTTQFIQKSPPERSRRQIFGQQAPPSISNAYLKDATLYLLEDFRHNIVISNSSSLTKVYVEGLLRGWTYEWVDTDKSKLAIVATGEDITRVENGVWTIRLEYGAQSREYKINWRVVQRAPVITNPGHQTLYKDFPINLVIDISHDPSVSMDGLLSKMKYVKQEGGALLSGEPDRLVSKSENRKIIINASTSGGSDREEFGFDIQELPTSFNVVYNTIGINDGNLYNLGRGNREVGSQTLIFKLRTYTLPNGVFLSGINLSSDHRDIPSGMFFYDNYLWVLYSQIGPSLGFRVYDINDFSHVRRFRGSNPSSILQGCDYISYMEGDINISRIIAIEQSGYVRFISFNPSDITKSSAPATLTYDRDRGFLATSIDNNILSVNNYSGISFDNTRRIIYISNWTKIYALDFSDASNPKYLGTLTFPTEISDAFSSGRIVRISDIKTLGSNLIYFVISNPLSGVSRRAYVIPAWSD